MDRIEAIQPSRSLRMGNSPLLLHVFPSFAPGGSETRTINLIRWLGEEFRHTILSMDGETSAADRLPSACAIRMVIGSELGSSVWLGLPIVRLLRKLDPDLVLTYNWGAIDATLAAILIGRKVVHHEDGFNIDEAESLKRRRGLARRVVLKFVDRCVVPSNRLLAIATEAWRIPRDRISLISNGVRIEQFPPADGNLELRRQLGIETGSVVMGSVGQLRKVKQQARLIDILKCLSETIDVHLLLVGDGVERRALEQRAHESGVSRRVHLVGMQTDVAAYLRAMDVFVLSSDSEQQPISLLEAMASSLPVVSTEVGDVAVVLPAAQRPFVVSLGHDDLVSEMSRLVSELLESSARRLELGSLNRQVVRESFNSSLMLQNYRDLYRSTIGSR